LERVVFSDNNLVESLVVSETDNPAHSTAYCTKRNNRECTNSTLSDCDNMSSFHLTKNVQHNIIE